MFGEPVLELGVSFEDELQSLTDDVVELVRPKELGITFRGLGKGLVDAQVEPARG
jgi:hypothetical protein